MAVDVSTQGTQAGLDALAQQAGYPSYDAWHDADPFTATQAQNKVTGTKGKAFTPWLQIAKDFGIPVGGFIAAGLAGGGAEAADAASSGADAASGASEVVDPALGAAPVAGGGDIAGAIASGQTPALTEGATTAASAGGTGSLLAKTLLKGAGAAIGGADAAAANNRGVANDYGLATWKAGNDYNLSAARLALDNNDLGLRGFNSNVQAKSDLENELMKRAQVEGDQRATDLKNLYKDSYAQHPSVSKFNTQGVPALSDQFKGALANVAAQGSAELSKPRTYNASTLAAPTMPTYTQPGFTVPTMTPAPPMQAPSTLEQAGNWLAPTLATASGFFNSSDPAQSDASMARRIAQYLQEQS